MKIEYLNHAILAAAFPSMVGTAIQCKKCRAILDCMSAIHVEVYVIGRDAPALSRIYCGKCKAAIIAGIADLTESKMHDGRVLAYDHAEVIDGAMLDMN